MPSLPATHPVIGTSLDDTLDGTVHSDVMSGRSGDDLLSGHNGNDEVWAGPGNDRLNGNNGNDKLFGSGGPNLVQAQTIAIVDDHPVSVIFEGETAGYRNSFGYYKVEPGTNRIYDVDIVWENASLAGSGGSLIAGQSSVLLDVEAGDEIGFFIVSNGYSHNNFSALGEGNYAFRNTDGSQASLASQDPRLIHLGSDGSETEIVFHQYHTAAYDQTVGLNPDGLLHTTGVLKTDQGTITLGFEDLLNGGDLDFDDSVFTVDLGTANANLLNAHYRTENGLDLIIGDGADGPPGIIPYEDDDTLDGGTGADELWGFRGDDSLFGQTGSDELHGGSDDDSLFGGSGSDQLFGNSGNDLLSGDNGRDHLHGNSGQDTVAGGHGGDTLYGGSGDDSLYGGQGNDELHGGSGDDSLSGDHGIDHLVGGSGSDSLSGGLGADLLQAGSGDDTLAGGSGHDRIEGGSGDDSLAGGAGNDSLLGGSGNDRLDGGSGSDVVNGGSGVDTVDYSDWASGVRVMLNEGTAVGNGTDSLLSIENVLASDYADLVVGDNRPNEIHGGGGADKLVGHANNDTVFGEAGNDRLFGASGADSLSGGLGDDLLRGGKGADRIDGGVGDDELWGGELTGGDSTLDTFLYDQGDGSDVIMDFEVGVDHIELSDLFTLDNPTLDLALSDQAGGAHLDLSLLGGELGDGLLLSGVSKVELDGQVWLTIA